MTEHAHKKPESQVVRKQNSQLISPKLASSESTSDAIQRIQQDDSTLRPADIMMLQRTIGNHAVQRMLNPRAVPVPTIQPKLKVGDANDAYEQEADRVARQVVNAPQRTPSAPSVQPKSLVQRTAENSFDAGSEFESRLSRTKSSGQPLPKNTKAEFESSFGANFSNVRIHTNSNSKELNRSIQAKAFTHGNDIHFGTGEFNPGSSEGKHLLAHELTHTIQQTGGEQLQRKGIASISDKGTNSAPARTAVQGMTIQRKMAFAATDLQGTLTLGAKAKGFFGAESTFSQLKKALVGYENSDGPAEELASLQVLKQLAEHWLATHDKDKKKDTDKEASTNRLLNEINIEIPLAQQRIQDDKDEQDDYIRQIEAKSLKFLSYSGAGMAKKMKGWHSGTDTMTNQAVNVHKLAQDHGLTLAEASAIGIYTADDYKYMNPAVANDEGWMRAMLPRTGIANLATRTGVSNGVTDEHVQEAKQEGNLHSKVAKSGMKKLPDWTGMTFRGLALTENEFAVKYPLNSVSVFPAFSSTSSKESISRGFASKEATNGKVAILLQLHLTKGKDIEKLSDAQGEAEILLMPGATFKVSKIKVGDHKGKKMYIVDCQQVK
jgi:hypothetical protein